MPYKFEASRAFWKQFGKLSAAEQAAAREKLRVFKQNPFAPSLGTHKINRLSALTGHTIYAVEILGDLRATFYQEGDKITSVSIGTHDIYK